MCTKMPVTVEYFCRKYDPDTNAWMFSKTGEEWGTGSWIPVEVSPSTDGKEYYLSYGGTYDYKEKKVGPDFVIYLKNLYYGKI